MVAQGVVGIAVKQLVRGAGLKIALLTSLVNTLLILIVWGSTPRYLLLVIPILSALSAVFTDALSIKSGFYALILVGASVKHITAYSITVGMIYAVIYVSPLLAIGFFTCLECLALIIVLLSSVMLLLATYYIYARRAFTLVTI